jgi:hypothetical protein
MRNSIENHLIIKCVLIIGYFCGALLMSTIVSSTTIEKNSQGFAITSLGDAQYGQNGIGIWTQTGGVRVSISDPLIAGLIDFRGAGTVESVLSHDDRNKAAHIFGRLCESTNTTSAPTPALPNQSRYSVRCANGGKMTNRGGALN